MGFRGQHSVFQSPDPCWKVTHTHGCLAGLADKTTAVLPLLLRATPNMGTTEHFDRLNMLKHSLMGKKHPGLLLICVPLLAL